MPFEARGRYDPAELVEVDGDGYVSPYDGPAVKRMADSSAEPPRPQMKLTTDTC
jgi:hypothetical protein